MAPRGFHCRDPPRWRSCPAQGRRHRVTEPDASVGSGLLQLDNSLRGWRRLCQFCTAIRFSFPILLPPRFLPWCRSLIKIQHPKLRVFSQRTQPVTQWTSGQGALVTTGTAFGTSSSHPGAAVSKDKITMATKDVQGRGLRPPRLVLEKSLITDFLGEKKRPDVRHLPISTV